MFPDATTLWIIRACSALLAVSLLVFGGCRWQAKHDAGKLEASAHALMVCGFDRDALAQALGEVNAIADQAKRDAAAQAVYAVEAVKQADRDRAEFNRKQAAITVALERAKRTPVCRAQLEAPLCIELH